MSDEPELSRPIIGPPEQYERRPERTDAVLLLLIGILFASGVIALYFLASPALD